MYPLISQMADTATSVSARSQRRASSVGTCNVAPNHNNNNNTHDDGCYSPPPSRSVSDAASSRRRRLSMSAAKASNLDCPAFLINSFVKTTEATKTTTSTNKASNPQTVRKGSRRSSSSHLSTTSSSNTVSKSKRETSMIQTRSSNKHSDQDRRIADGGTVSISPSKNNNDSSSHHRRSRQVHRESNSNNNNGQQHQSLNSKQSSTSQNHSKSMQHHPHHHHSQPRTPISLQTHLVPHRLHKPSISSSQKRQALLRKDDATIIDDTTHTSSLKRQTRRASLSVAGDGTTSALAVAPTTQSQRRRRSSTCLQRQVLQSSSSSSSCLNEHEVEDAAGYPTRHMSQSVQVVAATAATEDANVEEFAGDNDHNTTEPDESAWPSPFEADPFAEEEFGSNLFAQQKQRRLERQKRRNPAAAAASTILNTRPKNSRIDGNTTVRPSPTSMSLSRVVSLSRSPNAAAATTTTTTAAIPKDTITNVFGVPLTEPKKEAFTPSAHRRTIPLNLSGHSTFVHKQSDNITLTPVTSAHRRSMSADDNIAETRVPLLESAAVTGHNPLMRRSRSMEEGQRTDKLLPLSQLRPGSNDVAIKDWPSSSQRITKTTKATKASLSTETAKAGNSSPVSFSKANRKRPSTKSLIPQGDNKSAAETQTMSSRTIESLLLRPLKSSKSSVLTQSTASSISSDDLLKSETRASPQRAIIASVESGSSKSNRQVPSSSSRRGSNRKPKSDNDPTAKYSHQKTSSKRQAPGTDRKSHRKPRPSHEKLHAQIANPTSTNASSRIRRRFSYSHAPTTNNDDVSSMPRLARRVSTSSGMGIDCDVSAVVTTLNRMKVCAPKRVSTTEQQPQIHLMNW